MEELLKEAMVPKCFIDEFLTLLQSCLAPNVCQFNELVYRLPADIGIPIGSPLGSLISEVIMSKFESELFQSDHPLLPHIVTWRRYVDDVLCVWNGPTAHITDFLNHLNSLYPTT